MSKTLTMFGQLYQRLALLAHAPVRQLFDRLERFVSKNGDEDPADVSDAVAAFFDDLFPRLHGQSPRTVNQGPPLPANTLGVKLNQVGFQSLVAFVTGGRSVPGGEGQGEEGGMRRGEAYLTH